MYRNYRRLCLRSKQINQFKILNYGKIIHMSTQERWVGILDYAKLNSLSISTIRRKIKKKELQFKKVEGRYLFLLGPSMQGYNSAMKFFEMKLKNENDYLKEEIKQLKEENMELKMLLTLYENKT